MDDPKNKAWQQEMEAAVQEQDNRNYVLKLFVSGLTPKSQQAIDNLKTICEEHLKDRYELEVIDIFQQPELAQGGQIIATPTLIKELPLPMRKFIGDMSATDKILVGLELKPT
jgi:circadian clock protein KaiB